MSAADLSQGEDTNTSPSTPVSGVRKELTLMGKLITEIVKFGGDDKKHASQLAKILLPHIEKYAALQADKAVQDALQTVVAKAVENRTSVSIEIAEMLTELKGGSL